MNLIAIAGCSGSGKTVLARALEARLGDCAVLQLDAYYHPQSDRSLEERATQNYDHPDSIDWLLLESHLTALLQGKQIAAPRYLFDLHTRAPEPVVVEPAPVILVEGILALHRSEIRALASLRIFVETAERECYDRRILRDTAERGRTPESVIQQYCDFVQPMAAEYVLPSKQHADIVVGGQQPVEVAVDAILRCWQSR
jgi:uridine kinase